MLLFIFAAPIVPYETSIKIPGAVSPEVESCNGLPAPEESSCIAHFQSPPITITGYGSVGYYFSGIGISPYQSQYVISEGGQDATVHFTGSRVSYGETIPSGTITNTSSFLAVTNASLTPLPFGSFNLSMSVKNVGFLQSLANVKIETIFDNYTFEAMTWLGTVGPSSLCSRNLPPAASCTASVSFTPYPEPNIGQSYRAYVSGLIGKQTFTYEDSAIRVRSEQTIDAAWVASFIGSVNAARNSSSSSSSSSESSTASLRHNSTLDAFAMLRFKSLVENYSVTHNGLENDYLGFFNGSGRPSVVQEVYFNPENFSLPNDFASYVRESAPEHWAALTDQSFRQFGFYIGTGPAIIALQPCSVSEINGVGTDMRQYLTAHGCRYQTLEKANWLVVDLIP